MYAKLKDKPQSPTCKPHTNAQKLRKQLFRLIILFVICMMVLFQIDVQSGHGQSFTFPVEQSSAIEALHYGFLLDTPGCRIQKLEELSDSIKDFIYPEKLNCTVEAKFTEKFVWSDGKTLNLDQDSLEGKNITCCHSHFEQLPQDKLRYFGKCVPITGSVQVKEDFVEVQCYENQTLVFKNYYPFIQHRDLPIRDSRDRRMNVLIIGIDSVSRLNLHRQMPKTVQWLKSQGGLEMFGYNKVGDNTFPNLMAALTGKTEEELKQSCWPNATSTFDDCYFVWNDFTKKGFVTGYGEDAVRLGLFNYMRGGFDRAPTNVYLNPFILQAEKQIGHTKRLNSHLCVGTKTTVQFLIDSAFSFAMGVGEPFFGFFWGTSLTHDYLNMPKLGDETYSQFLTAIEGILDRTVLVFLSDHGIRWGDMRDTYQGFMEERLPFLFFVIPTKFRKQFDTSAENLKMNRFRLTTPFDLYETLKDLSDVARLKAQRKVNSSRGISLFLPISDTRNCSSAGITPNWCTCHSSLPVPIDEKVENAAQAIVDHINFLVKKTRCSQLSLQTIKSARMERVSVDPKDKKNKAVAPLDDFVVTIVTTPGAAVFQGTVRHDPVSSKFLVLPPVSRLNIYGSQSHCAPNYHLRLYCFCKS